MTLASGVEKAVIGFDYHAEAELFPNRNRKPKRHPIGYRRFTHAPTPSALRSKSFHLSFSWGPFSKSTKKDTTRTEFAGCTRAWTIP